MSIQGRCHCGNLSFEFETALQKLQPRACACRFCRVHGVSSVTDPKGKARLFVKNRAKLHRYRFAEQTADFLICRECGCYIGAVIEHAGQTRATLNLRMTSLKDTAAKPVSYTGESAATRRARRLKLWTPAVIRFV